ncbi:MAG: hypothetical protein Q4A16_09265 [Lautropia sp.]|nr:hypothetical protein [Lautropia sp.]
MFQIPLPFAQLVLSALNHVTRQQPHLRESLSAHAGRVLRIEVISPLAAGVDGAGGGHSAGQTAARTASPASVDTRANAGVGAVDEARAGGMQEADGLAALLPSLQSDARIGGDGSLSAVSGEQPAAVLTVRPSADALFTVMRQGPNALGASVRIEGDVMLASALGQVARSLSWDVEEDLSRIVGDMAAHRAGMAWRAVRQQAGETGNRMREALAQHLGHDEGVLLSRTAFEQWVSDLRLLNQRLGQLEARQL